MAVLDCRPRVFATITLELSEQEAAALDALAGYGDDAFLRVFYEHMGRAYLEPYEKGLRSLLRSVRSAESGVPLFLSKIREARKVFEAHKPTKPTP